MKIYLVTAEHFSTPGLIQMAFARESDAIAEAVKITVAMRNDAGLEPLPGPTHYSEEIERLQDIHGAAHCYVEITEIDVAGGVTTDNASPRPWTYRNVADGPGLGSRDWIEDANGSIILENVGHLDGPLICASVNGREG